jgi:hypothetical protein
MKTKFYLGLLFIFFCTAFSFAQNWVEKMQTPNANFYDIKTDFENYWLTEDKAQKGKGYKAFKRWENFVERRVYPSGDLSLLNLTAKNYEEFLKTQTLPSTGNGKLIGNGSNLTASATFTAMGPFGAISGSAGSQLLKSGRLNFVTIDPTNSSNLWVGAPAGGLWKSTNGGTSWTTNTDNIAVIGCSDLAIDPTNTNTMYLATGDGDAGDTRSIGVLKSTDGGLTWVATGLTSPVTSYFLIRRLIIDPSNTQVLLAATNTGIYRTSNGGVSWSQVSTSNCYDLEFKPGDPNTVYAGGTSLRVSTNNGVSFTQITSGITSSAGRMAIAVTPHDVNYVYVLACNNSNYGLLGLYRSTNSGATFSVMSTTPNILDGSTAGSGTGGQGWYDLCIAASPLNKDEIVTGGVNVWRSLNGGSSWSLFGHWTGSGGAPFTHADQHDLEFDAAGTLFNANDGTLYKRTGTTWTEISGSMNISQIYRIGLSTLTANKWITGHQDNGSSIWNGSNYLAKLGGDGMDCFYDRTNDNNVFGEYQNGVLQRSTNGGTSWSSATSGLTGTPPWVTVWKQDPQTANTIYVGYTDLFKSTNLGVSWTALTAIPGTGTIREFVVAPSNSLTIYVLKSSGIYKTTNGGTSWTNVTGTVPVGSASPEFICIDPLDANNAWVVLSGYSSGNKVFVTTNGGTSWTNFSANLPNIPANCCVYEPGSNDRIYIGMDVGIYYRDNLSSTWTLYNTGLPNVPVSDLEISPASPTLLHAATFGRGVWVASLVSAATVPASAFITTVTTKCAQTAITFSDQSTNSPTIWNWGVSPSAGVTINSNVSQNPTITFPSGGIYTVIFQAFNTNGPGATVSQTVSIVNSPTLLVSTSSQTVCGGAPAVFTASGAATYSWSNGGGSSATASFQPNSSTTYTVTGTTNGCSSKKTVSVTTAANSNISVSGPNAICTGNYAVLLASGAISYSWSTNSNSPFIYVTPSVTTVYTVNGTTANNCKPVATVTLVVNALPNISITGDLIVCLGESSVLNANGATNYTWMPGGQTGNSTIYTPSATSVYTCTGIDANGCANSNTVTVDALVCQGAKELSLNNNLYSLFPNPTKGKLTLKVNGIIRVTPITLDILDMSGKKVFGKQFVFSDSEKEIEINISSLSTGFYFVRLGSETENSDLIRILKE